MPETIVDHAESIYDTPLIRRAYRRLSQRTLLMFCGVTLCYAVLLAFNGNGAWAMYAALAFVPLVFYDTMAPHRPFSLFLASLLCFTVIAATTLALSSEYFGRYSAFHFLLVLFVPMVIFAGRINFAV